jgi:superfamily II DNA or RNA helicase
METRGRDMSALTLRPYQSTAVDTVFDCIARGERRIVLNIPVRGGKTLIGTKISQYFLEDGKRVAFVTPRLVLIEQTCRA